MEQPPFLSKERRGKTDQEGRQKGRQEGRQAPEPEPEPARNRKSWRNSLLFWAKKEKTRRETRRETSPGTRTSKKQEIMMEQPPFLSKERRDKTDQEGRQKGRQEGRQAPEPEPEPARNRKSWRNSLLFWAKKEKTRRETRRETSPGTRTSKKQEIMMEQPPFLSKERRDKTDQEGRQKGRQEGRQAPEPEPEPARNRKSWRNRLVFEQRKKKQEGRQEGRQALEPEPEPARNRKSWWNSLLFWANKEETRRKTRRETSPGTKAETRKNQKIMMEQRPFLARIENPIQIESCLGKHPTHSDVQKNFGFPNGTAGRRSVRHLFSKHICHGYSSSSSSPKIPREHGRQTSDQYRKERGKAQATRPKSQVSRGERGTNGATNKDMNA